jgi:outer membrane biosynthesis protein TonB
VSDDVFVNPSSRNRNAEETPLGRYYRQVIQAVEKKWRIYINIRPGALSVGYLEVVFYVNAKGKVEDMIIADDKDSNVMFTSATLQAIKDAEIPPMPADVILLLSKSDQGRLKIEYNALITYAEPKSSKGGKKAAMKADKTARGRYYWQVIEQVEKKWKDYRQQRSKDVSAGSLKVEFYVNKKGKVEGLRVIDDKKSNPLLTEITLQAIKDAEIPPMPADVIPLLPKDDPERLKIEYNAVVN